MNEDDGAKLTSLRIPGPEMKRIEACKALIEKRHPGLKISQTNTIMMLIERGLDQFEAREMKQRTTQEGKP